MSDRLIYQSAAVYASKSPATGQFDTMSVWGNFATATGTNYITQIPRVQSFTITPNIPRQNVFELGQLARLDAIIIEPPTVNMDLNWYLLDGKAESILGFAASGQATFISGLLDGTNDDKNFFVRLTPEGTDAVGSNSVTDKVLSVGNAFVSNYNCEFQVGQIPTASVTAEGLNIATYTGISGQPSPAINPPNGLDITGWSFQLPVATAYTGALTPSALRPGDITLNLDTGAAFGTILPSGAAGTPGSVNVQSVRISLPLRRQLLQRLGAPYGYTRKIEVPIITTMSVEALQTDLTASRLSSVFCNDKFYNFNVQVQVPNCSRTGANAVTVWFKNGKMTNQSYNMSIGPNATTTMTFEATIAGLGDSTNGVFFSGSYS